MTRTDLAQLGSFEVRRKVQPDVTLDDLCRRVALPRAELLCTELGPLGDPLAGIDGLTVRGQHGRGPRRFLPGAERSVVPRTSLTFDDLRTTNKPTC
jgi:hypothetical protein